MQKKVDSIATRPPESKVNLTTETVSHHSLADKTLSTSTVTSIAPTDNIARLTTPDVAVVFSIVLTILLFLLQGNGVTRINWLLSSVMYVGLLAFVLWALSKWNRLDRSKPWKRIPIISACTLALAIIAGAGVFNEYRLERNSQGNIVRGNAPEAIAREAEVLNQLLGGKDEYALRELFGLRHMVEINIAYNTERILAQRKGGQDTAVVENYFDLYPQGLYDRSKGHPEPSTGRLIQSIDPHAVNNLFFPKEYSDNQAKLIKFENSGALPQPLADAVRNFDRTLQDIISGLLDTLDDAFQGHPDYFIHHNDSSSKDARSIDEMTIDAFIPLKPRADAIVTNIRRLFSSE